jgi:hypothetical protein
VEHPVPFAPGHAGTWKWAGMVLLFAALGFALKWGAAVTIVILATITTRIYLGWRIKSEAGSPPIHARGTRRRVQATRGIRKRVHRPGNRRRDIT